MEETTLNVIEEVFTLEMTADESSQTLQITEVVGVEILDVAIQGEQGTPGVDGSGDLNYTHIQNVPASVWVVNHNLGKYPTPEIVDSAGTRVFGDLFYNSINQFTLTFSVPFSGKVFCN